MTKFVFPEVELIVWSQLVPQPGVISRTRHQIVGTAHQCDIEALDFGQIVIWRCLLPILLLVSLRRAKIKLSEPTVVKKLMKVVDLSEAAA
jgi:hypothetical protein